MYPFISLYLILYYPSPAVNQNILVLFFLVPLYIMGRAHPSLQPVAYAFFYLKKIFWSSRCDSSLCLEQVLASLLDPRPSTIQVSVAALSRYIETN